MQFWKALSPIVEIEVGTFTVINDWQLRNAADSITEMVGGRVTEVMPL